MAITTSASDAGAVLLDVGTRPKGGTKEGGDSFAAALEGEMKPVQRGGKAERETGRKEPTTQDSAEKDRVSSRERPAAAASKEAAKAEEPTDESDLPIAAEAESLDESEAANTEVLDAELLPETTELLTAGSEEPAVVVPPGGNILPLAATEAAEAASVVAVATPVAGAATRATASLAASRVLTGTPETAAGDSDARLQADAEFAEVMDGHTRANAKMGVEADPATAPVRRNTDALLQAMRMGLSQGQPSGEGKSESVPAALAARDLPRSAEVLPTTPSATQAMPLATASNTPTANAPVSTSIAVPLGQQGWDQAMGERVVWMTRQGLQEAQIQLHPRELGPVEVRVSVHQDQASVSFTAHTPAAREALESALPRLREMLADSGLNLVQSDVSHQSPQQRQEGGTEGGRYGRGMGPVVPESAEEVVVRGETAVGSGAVDFYA